ncbi:lysophospholipid acyltransferase family protein [soil metagenome]
MLLTSEPKSPPAARRIKPLRRTIEPISAARRGANSTWFYNLLCHFGRHVTRQCLRQIVLHRDRADRAGGYVLAPTHISHIEPMLISCLMDRPISWMARIEFFRVPILARLLRWANSFPVNRQGVPVRAIRTAIVRAKNGEVVGIFPEGGCRNGKDLAVRGGRIREGACTVAIRAGVPIVPVVVLGTHALNDIDPWIPAHQGKVWIAFGHAICPPPVPPTRRDQRVLRQKLARELEREYMRTYHELLAHASLSDGMTP